MSNNNIRTYFLSIKQASTTVALKLFLCEMYFHAFYQVWSIKTYLKSLRKWEIKLLAFLWLLLTKYSFSGQKLDQYGRSLMSQSKNLVSPLIYFPSLLYTSIYVFSFHNCGIMEVAWELLVVGRLIFKFKIQLILPLVLMQFEGQPTWMTHFLPASSKNNLN